MIQNLILQIASLLAEVLAAVIPDADHIKTRPFQSENGDQLPLIALTPGQLTVSPQPGESGAIAPRPEDIRQTFAVSSTLPAGPYLLSRTPLQGSTRIKAIYQAGTLTEKQIWLQETKDFTIDASNKTCLVTADLSGVESLVVFYSTVSIFTQRDFVQVMLIQIYASDFAAIEPIASLVAGAVLAHHDRLVAAYNQPPPHQTEYSGGGVVATHQLRQIQLLAGIPAFSPVATLELQFSVAGQFKAAREITEGFGLIEKIHSPGRTSTQSVDIAIAVE